MAEHLPQAVAQRVALLARPGKAADNLADALRQAGADLVLVADPNTLDEAALMAAEPQAVLVALEPGVEQAIDRLDAVLSSPQLTVIFDEADLAAHRAGWDAARWIRHLSAKLHHHQQVLPPGGEAENENIDWHPSPGQLPKSSTDFAEMDFGAFAQEAAVRADAVPTDGMHFDTTTHENPDAASVPAEPISPLSLESADSSRESDWSVAPHAEVEAEAPREMRTDEVLSFDTLVLTDITVDAPAFDEPAFDESSFDELSIDMLDMSSTGMSSTDVPSLDMSSPDMSSTDTSNDVAPIEMSQFEEIRLSQDDASIADTSNLQPMQFDDDAFFLEELSADASSVERFDASSTIAFDDGLRFDDEPRFDDASSSGVSSDATRADRFDLEISDLSLSDDSVDEAANETSLQPPALPDTSAAGVSGFSNNTFGELSLASGDAPRVASPELRSGAFSHDLSSLEARISGLSLVDVETASDSTDVSPDDASLPPVWEETPLRPAQLEPAQLQPAQLQPADTTTAAPTSIASASRSRGVVLIEAGLGGPDPVRQVLAGLPATFPMPILVRLHLQGGRYDRLVTQMERAASLPVMLAEVGDVLRDGCIYFLPEGVGLHALTDGMEFIAHPSPATTIFAALPAEDSAILFLSGSDATLIEDAMQAADAGALVIAQSPEDCYDGAACAYLASRGAASGLPPDLAQRLLWRWMS